MDKREVEEIKELLQRIEKDYQEYLQVRSKLLKRKESLSDQQTRVVRRLLIKSSFTTEAIASTSGYTVSHIQKAKKRSRVSIQCAIDICDAIIRLQKGQNKIGVKK